MVSGTLNTAKRRAVLMIYKWYKCNNTYLRYGVLETKHMYMDGNENDKLNVSANKYLSMIYLSAQD